MPRRNRTTTTFVDSAKAQAQAQADSLANAVASVKHSLDQASAALADANAKLARLADG